MRLPTPLIRHTRQGGIEMPTAQHRPYGAPCLHQQPHGGGRGVTSRHPISGAVRPNCLPFHRRSRDRRPRHPRGYFVSFASVGRVARDV